MPKYHFAAHVFKVWLHSQGHSKLLREKLLGWGLAEVDTHADAPTLCQVPALFNVYSTLLHNAIYFSILRLAWAHQPLKKRGRYPGVHFSSPLAIWKHLPKPLWHLRKSLDHCSALLCSSSSLIAVQVKGRLYQAIVATRSQQARATRSCFERWRQ